MALYRSILVYIFSKSAGAGAGAKVRAQKTAGVRVEAKVPLPVVIALPATLSLPAGRSLQQELQRVRAPATRLAEGIVSEGKLLLLLNGVADPLGLELLKM